MENVCALYEHYISNTKNKVISNNMAIKYARFCWKVRKMYMQYPFEIVCILLQPLVYFFCMQ